MLRHPGGGQSQKASKNTCLVSVAPAWERGGIPLEGQYQNPECSGTTGDAYLKHFYKGSGPPVQLED